jgi:hypothetical protein
MKENFHKCDLNASIWLNLSYSSLFRDVDGYVFNYIESVIKQ